MVKDNQDFANNTVSAKGQLKPNENVSFGEGKGGKKVLFIGNSITRHGILESIGWYKDCGMAASCIEKDYVHVATKQLKKKFGDIEYCIAQLAVWEWNFLDESVLHSFYQAKDFNADIIIVNLGGNVDIKDTEKDREEFLSALVKMIRYFKGETKAKVIICSQFWRRRFLDDQFYKASVILKCDYVEMGDIGDKAENKAIGEYEHQGVQLHPNDLGMQRIAERILEKI